MKSNNDDINKISDDRLDWLIKNQDILENIPEDVDNEIILRLRGKIKSRNKRKNNKLVILYRFKELIAAAVFLIFITIGAIFFLNKSSFFNKEKTVLCQIEKFDGQILLNNKSYDENFNDKVIRSGNTIYINDNSSLDLRIGDKSFVSLKEFSEIKINKLNMKKKDEYSSVYLTKGNISCSINLPSKNSRFEVITDACLFAVKGTQFDIHISENKDVILKVISGIVEAENFIGKNVILDKNAIPELVNLIDYFIQVKEGQVVAFKNDDIIKYNFGLAELIKKWNNNLIQKEKFLSELKNFEIKKNQLFTFTEISKDDGKLMSDDNTFTSNKLNINIGHKFNENDTAVVSDDKRFLYISSDFNKSVYCVDVKNQKLNWKFSDRKISNITSPAIPFNDKVVLATPKHIFVLDQSGNIIESKEISNGPSYWAYPKIFNNRIYIPTFDSIYFYDEKNIQKINNSLVLNGQGYIDVLKGNIYFSALNEKRIKKYDLKENRITWESDVLFERVFIEPLVVDENLFTADIKGNIYQFDVKKNTKNFIKSDAGVISNLIYSGNILYFISDNGFLNRVFLDKFSKSEKIFQIDNKPSRDKYLTKKMLFKNNNIFYCSDSGKLLVYNIKNLNGNFLKLSGNDKNSALVGEPVIIGEDIIVIDIESNIYKIVNSNK